MNESRDSAPLPGDADDWNADLSRRVAGLSTGEHWCELSAEAIICLDERWRVLFFNRRATELLPAGDTLEIGQPPWRCATLLALLEQLHTDTLGARGQQGRPAFRHVSVRGTGAQAFDATVTVAGDQNRRVFFLGIREEPLDGPDRQKLYQSQQRQMVGALAGGIAHDFNNILTAVICQLDLASQTRELPTTARESISQALKSARRGAELNAKLLEFSRHSATPPICIQAAQLVEEAVFLLRRGVDRRILVRWDPTGHGGWLVRVDTRRFLQVLLNLGLNACDAMPKGGEVSFQITNRCFSTHEIHPPRRPGEFVEVAVNDTGHGMTPEILAHLFEPYFTTKQFGRGAGLGLSIANHVVVEHAGWMEVESEAGRGSRFKVFLPRAADSRAPTLESPLPELASGGALDGHETVLLADDEQSVREVIRAMLTFRGYQVIEAADGAEAIERFGSAAAEIKLVLLDVQMPRLDGWDTMERIHELNPQVPVLLLSGGMSDSPADNHRRPGAAGVLRKPFASEELLRALRQALDRGPAKP